MGGVDRADALRQHRTCIRWSKKWWHVFFYYILDHSIVNAMVLFRAQEYGNSNDRDQFLYSVIEGLVGENLMI
jgi:hypothetical protein